MENEKKIAITKAHNDPWASRLMREYGEDNKFYLRHRHYNVALEHGDLFNYLGIKLYLITPEILERVNRIMMIIGKWEEFRKDGILMGWRRINDAGRLTAADDKILDRYDFELSNDEVTLDDYVNAKKKLLTVLLRRQKDGEPVDVEKQFYKRMYNDVKAKLCTEEIMNGLIYTINGESYTNNGAILRYLAGKAIDNKQANIPAVEMDKMIVTAARYNKKVLTAMEFDRQLSNALR